MTYFTETQLIAFGRKLLRAETAVAEELAVRLFQERGRPAGKTAYELFRSAQSISNATNGDYWSAYGWSQRFSDIWGKREVPSYLEPLFEALRESAEKR